MPVISAAVRFRTAAPNDDIGCMSIVIACYHVAGVRCLRRDAIVQSVWECCA